MFRRLFTAAVLAGAALVATTAPAGAATGPRDACGAVGPTMARCLTRYAPPVTAVAAETPEGWGATDLGQAYRLPADAGPGDLVAISVAYDSPALQQDLAAYRAQYGLPPCTSDTGCFRKVNQRGETGPLPGQNYGWNVEATLDVSMVSAACPSCRLLVVEGDSPDFADLAATEDTAVRLGAKIVTNSYGGRESGVSLAFASSYQHPGVTTVVSSGDAGYTAASFPAVLPDAVAVGGTTLTRDSSARGFTESAWSRGGSGCSAYVAKPSWQKDPHCRNRTVADVSAAAEQLAIHFTDAGGWGTAEGTSASAPFVAGLIARAGRAGTTTAATLYAGAAHFFDVTDGTNDRLSGGAKCGGDYLCVAAAGYDAPTGVGTPDGLAGF
ncbi:S8 family serine peptidase [Amycolatopsis sp. NPDC051903]|uniref:S53 family peptidase n=1 Tax=Amycolatopsis sp. NPDC051903 TaxID=3363936 RepID=UPI0037B221D8